MRTRLLVSAAIALTAAALIPTLASAAPAEALTDLNLRAGPGPNYPVIGVIDTRNTANVVGCIEGSLWCEVSYNGKTGWAYSKYLAMNRANQRVVIAEHPQEVGVPVITYNGPAAGAATGAITGALVGGPVGAAVGATVGAAAAPAAIVNPPPAVRSYVVEHRVQPVYLNGEVVVGASVPQTVALYPVPGYQYEYAYVNQVPVLVNPQSREIVYIYR